MNLTLIPLNGKCPYFDYESFERSAQTVLQPTCKEATVILLNNFPALISTETSIDLVIIFAIKKVYQNYFRIRKGENWVNIYNLILPIKFITSLQEKEINLDEDDQVVCENEIIDYSNEIPKLKFSLLEYLSRRCNFKRDELFINPLIHIKNNSTLAKPYLLVSKTLDFFNLVTYLKSISQETFCSYQKWKTEDGYTSLPMYIDAVSNQASKDSEVGYITKRKIERIARQLSNHRNIYEDLNKHLVIVQGKAGTGKSSELILLMMRCIKKGQNTLFLTYNRLLIYDIARTIKSYVNQLYASNNQRDEIGEHPVMTLHSFFYRFSKSLGVLHILTEERKGDLLSNLNARTTAIKTFINSIVKSRNSYSFTNRDLDSLKEKIQNNNHFDIPTKEVGIDLINFIKKKSFYWLEKVDEIVLLFIKFKSSLVNNIMVNEVFLSDYYGVLENTLLAIRDPSAYFSKYNIERKFELLAGVMNLKEKHLQEDSDLIEEKAFRETINRKVGGQKRKRTIFVDEAQDCHIKERDILVWIFGHQNIVISNGGKEQLIRHVELCNWEGTKHNKVEVKKYYTSNRSFRIKKSVLEFCNFVANKFNIELKLEPLESEDIGELIFDFRNTSDSDIQQVFKTLTVKGTANGCTPYESVLVLLDSHSKVDMLDDFYEETESDRENLKGKINEFDNIEDSYRIKKVEWKYKGELERVNEIMFWDGTEEDKSHMPIPYPNETRLIYYDSCRGIESWSVACFNIDKFFDQKCADPDAEKFLIGEEKDDATKDLFISNDVRKKMFAGTWALMAITRAIDTLYLKFDNTDSVFSKLVLEYASANPSSVRVMR